jgi:SAM-dependent methyltransferase
MAAGTWQVTVERLGASFRDPSGFVYRSDGVLYRQINPPYRPHYERLMAGGLYDELCARHLLLPHTEADLSLAAQPGAYRVIRPEPVPFVSYPFEWCFSQLQDAAMVTLEIQRLALARGMTLKDASARNIQFRAGRPVLIDTLSFETLRPGAPWQAYRQFCQHFLAPLLLMSRTDVRLSGLLREHLDGVPLDLAARLLPASSRLRFSSLLHVHLHARSLRNHAHTSLKARKRDLSVSPRAQLGLIDNLETATRALRWRPADSPWADYEGTHNYSAEAAQDKTRAIRELLDLAGPASVWDLGANTGAYSRVAAERGAWVLALDGDAAAVELNYRRMRERGETALLPLLMDLTNPTASGGWAGEEWLSLPQRGSPDLIMALALLHHLAIGNNVPLRRVAEYFSRLAPRLIVEFVPKEDVQVQRLLGSREDIFDRYTRQDFEADFGERYAVLASRPITGSERRLYLMERHG